MLRISPLKYVGILLAVLGFSLLFSAKQLALSCQRERDLTVSCIKREKLSIGIVSNEIPISNVQSVRLEIKSKKTFDSTDGHGLPHVKDRDVYGVVINGDESIYLDAFDYDRQRQENRVSKIQAFLLDDTQDFMTLDLRNSWSSLVTILVLATSGYCFYKSQKKISPGKAKAQK